MDWISNYIVVEIAGAVFGLIIYLLAKQTKPREAGGKIVLRLPIIYWYLAIFLLIFLFGLLVKVYYPEFKTGEFRLPSDLAAFYISFPMMIASVIIMFYYKNHEIIIDKNSIQSFGLFRNKSELFWKEINKVTFNQSAFRVYGPKVKIEVITYLAGLDIFLKTLRETVPTEISKDALKKYKDS
ncbi:hypothetical protein [Leptospira haakeii]|uniref:DUF5673 domain-containing protein n=1 Tax=Leptospira haakeii TaxID=2023198 RepID=A0ABX4PH36_9LEPT|nr:hypothetical protein [Leptospira haakeii]PKA14943.1 hypothetical protein CH363_16275 [Leptospira haakeii]PKA20404.1 hypothetical protein CH377_05625 [Leptospira haakeii]